MLDAAWADSQHSHVVEWVAARRRGQVRWSSAGWRMCSGTVGAGAQVYVWSFTARAPAMTGKRRMTTFERRPWPGLALNWTPATPLGQGQRLAEAVAASRTLLVLDGVEPLQYPPGPLAGEQLRRAQGAAGMPGQCGSARPVPGHQPGAADGLGPIPA